MFKALVPVASVRIHSCLKLCGRARSFGTDLKDNMKQGKVTTMPILPEQHKDIFSTQCAMEQAFVALNSIACLFKSSDSGTIGCTCLPLVQNRLVAGARLRSAKCILGQANSHVSRQLQVFLSCKQRPAKRGQRPVQPACPRSAPGESG